MKKLIVVLLLLLCLTAQGWEQKPILGRQINWAHPLSKGLVGYWPMSENGGSTVLDLSGNVNTGTFVNQAHFVSGQFGSAISFDGTGDYIALPSSITLTGAFTFFLYFNGVDVTYRDMLGQLDGNDSIFHHSNSTLLAIQVDGSVKTFTFPTISTNVWYHLVVTRDSNNDVRMYLNGIESSTGAVNRSGTFSFDGIGIRDAAGENYGYSGMLDNIGVFNRTLTASEAAQLYREPFCILKRTPIWMFRMVPTVGGQVIIINMQ